MSLRPRSLPTGFISPCLPTAAPSAPSTSGSMKSSTMASGSSRAKRTSARPPAGLVARQFGGGPAGGVLADQRYSSARTDRTIARLNPSAIENFRPARRLARTSRALPGCGERLRRQSRLARAGGTALHAGQRSRAAAARHIWSPLALVVVFGDLASGRVLLAHTDTISSVKSPALGIECTVRSVGTLEALRSFSYLSCHSKVISLTFYDQRVPSWSELKLGVLRTQQ